MAEHATDNPFVPMGPESARAFQRYQAHLRMNPKCHCGRAASIVTGQKVRGAWSHRSVCDLHRPVEQRLTLPAPRSTYSLRDSIRPPKAAGPTDQFHAKVMRAQRELDGLTRQLSPRRR